ncbi:MAG: hypothetical protein MUE46_11775 [Xanthomonadales bacterium]|nr:hypothetical protein [Xanthomonadales bacterium]
MDTLVFLKAAKSSVGNAIHQSSAWAGDLLRDTAAELLHTYSAENRPGPFVTRVHPHPLHRNRCGLEFLVFGSACRVVAPLIAAVRYAASHGFVNQGAAVQVLDTSIWSEDGPESWQGQTAPALSLLAMDVEQVWESPLVEVQLLSPLRMLHTARGAADGASRKGEEQLLGAGHFESSLFLKNVIARVDWLARVYCGYDGAALPRFETRLVSQKLQALSNAYRSARQDRIIPLDGVEGSFLMAMDPAAWPWLWAGSWVHAGKATVQGYGRYQLVAR